MESMVHSQTSAGSYFSCNELVELGFASLGSNVLVSRKASIYDHDRISLSDNVRIDDFCCLSGKIDVGRNTHITPFCLVAGGSEGVHIGDFCALAYRVSVFSQTDNYHGLSMVNSTIPPRYKLETKETVSICDHVIIGAGSVVLPGIQLAIGTAIGATSLVTDSTEPWGLYFGVPAKRRKERSKKVLEVTQEYLVATSACPEGS